MHSFAPASIASSKTFSSDISFLSTGIEWIPLNKIELSNVEKDEIVNFLGTLDEDEDIQNVYTNAKL